MQLPELLEGRFLRVCACPPSSPPSLQRDRKELADEIPTAKLIEAG